LNHALQHTAGEAKITLRTKIVQAHVLIQVIDPDREISEAEQQLVFEQFYRSQENRVNPLQPNRSTGLGLTLVKKLVEILQATIAVSSDRQGTIFTVTLPWE
ncbi:MAG: hypothetical protein RLZZ69_1282, partial [Cyanobacteriota bacterium]